MDENDGELFWNLRVVSNNYDADDDRASSTISATKPTSSSSYQFTNSIRHLFEQFVGQDEEGGLTNDTDVLEKNNITTEVTHQESVNETAIYTTITDDINATEEVVDDVFHPIRLRAILAESEGKGELLTEEERYSLFQDLLSPALLPWSNALRVDPVVGNLTVDVAQLVDGETCGPGKASGLPSVKVPLSHLEEGVAETDMIVYLSLGFAERSTNLTTSNSTLLNATDDKIIDREGEEADDDNTVTNGKDRSLLLKNTGDPNSSHEEEVLKEAFDTYVYNRTQEELDTLRAEAVCAGDYLAAASFCSTDQYDRPTAALLHICIDEFFFEPKNRHRNILAVTHELGHALGFNSLSMAHFRRTDGTPYTERVDGDIPDTEIECTGPKSERKRGTVALPSEDILQFRDVRGGVRVAELVTPSVLQVVRNQFDCQNLTGAELESGETLPLGTAEEGYSCIGDHWERRLFSSDILNPVVEDLEYYPRISTLTLAYFADSGWYQVDLSGSRVASGWGRGAGCGFVNEACISESGQVPPQNAAFFCNEIPRIQARSVASEVSACTPDLSRKAVCSMGHYGLDLPWEYRYFQDIYGSDVGGNDPLMDYCPVYTGYDNGLCSNPTAQGAIMASHIERFGERNSRCLVGNLNPRIQQHTALCLPIACVVEDRSLRVKIDGIWYKCNEADQELRQGTISVVCPDPRRICPTFYCPYDCLGTGGQCDYNTGQCLCDVPGIYEQDESLLLPCGEELEEENPGKANSLIVRPHNAGSNDELPPDDSPLSDYYVPTERSLVEADSRPLEAWMIALMSVGAFTVLSLGVLICYTRKPDEDSRWSQAWFVRTSSTEESSDIRHSDQPVESMNRNKDKMIATVLVDLRIHNENEGPESLADTEEQMTESEASRCAYSESSSDYSSPRSDSQSEVDRTLDDIPETDVEDLQEETQVIRRRRFFGPSF